MARRFILSNFLLIVVAFAAWYAGLLDWTATLPRATWLMIGFLCVVWLGGMCAAVAGKWRTTFHVANAIPMVGLIMTGLGIQIAGAGITELSPDAAFVLFRGILQSMSTTFIGLALMMSLRETAWWVGETHI